MPPSRPEFNPHPLLRGGHAQTLAGILVRSGAFVETATRREVLLGDGDRIVLHDDCPADWTAGGPTTLLIHGLAGCHASPYMRRIARKLNARGVRTFRMDLRGCGAGLELARYPYHSGRSEDAAAALAAIGELCPGSPTTLVGFSLGGNIALKLLGEAPHALPANLRRAVAVCPPVDLLECVTAIARGVNRIYDRYFTRLLMEQVATRRRLLPETVVPPEWPDRKARRSILEFDERFTAPVSGFGTAANYYRLCSSARFIPQIRLPTVILAAADDPLVPVGAFGRLALPREVTLYVTRHGGHLGFLARSNGDPDRRWLDWRVVEWCCAS
jgi:predicted alpha/beta-fold hydrolase